MTIHAETAKAIRKELREKFPETKFRVTSESYSMGSAVRVAWAGGPESRTVRELLEKYQYGNYNSMGDFYEFNTIKDGFPQVKFVTLEREAE